MVVYSGCVLLARPHKYSHKSNLLFKKIVIILKILYPQEYVSCPMVRMYCILIMHNYICILLTVMYGT